MQSPSTFVPYQGYIFVVTDPVAAYWRRMAVFANHGQSCFFSCTLVTAVTISTRDRQLMPQVFA